MPRKKKAGKSRTCDTAGGLAPPLPGAESSAQPAASVACPGAGVAAADMVPAHPATRGEARSGSDERPSAEDDDDMPPACWTRSTAEWEWEQARRKRLERVAQKFRGRASTAGLATPGVKSGTAQSSIVGGGAQATDGAAATAVGGSIQNITASEGDQETSCGVTALAHSDTLETGLVCPQCAGEYTAAGKDFAPKLLPCFHSVCATCAQDLQKYKGPGRRCPVCREDVGHAGLVDNLVVLDLLAAHQLESARDVACANECIGEDADATHFCEDCVKFLCRVCVSMHSRQRATVGHTVVTKQELQSPASKGRRNSFRRDPSTDKCSTHPDQQLDLYCTTCSVVVCPKCALLSHPPPAHDLEGAAEAFDDATHSIRGLADRCTEALERLNASRMGMLRMREALQSNAEQALLEIEAWQNEMQEQVRAKALQAKERVAQRKEAQDCLWDGREEALSHAISVLQDLHTFGSAALETPSRLRFVVQISKPLVDRLQKSLAEVPDPDLWTSHEMSDGNIQRMPSIFDLFRETDERPSSTRATPALERARDSTESRTSGRARAENESESTQLATNGMYEECKRALEEAKREVERERRCREEMESTISVMRQAADAQTDAIVSLESDLRRALGGRDSLQQRLLEHQESAAIAEIERVVSLEAECKRLRDVLEKERSAAASAAVENLGRTVGREGVPDEARARGGGLDAEAEAQLNRIAEELEAAAVEWRCKYCDLRIKAEVLLARVKGAAKLLLDEIKSCRQMSDQALLIWRESEQLTPVRAMLSEGPRPMPADTAGGVDRQCPVSPPALSPDVTARLVAEMKSARVQREQETGWLGDGAATPLPTASFASQARGVQQLVNVVLKIEPKLVCTCCQGKDNAAGGAHVEGVGEEDEESRRNGTSTKEQLLELELRALKLEHTSAEERWKRERDALLGDLQDGRRPLTVSSVSPAGTREGEGGNASGRARPCSLELDAAGAVAVMGVTAGKAEVDSELKMLKNEYMNAQVAWGKERAELQSQFRSVLQACMEAEIAAEQGRKRESALHAALQAEKQASAASSSPSAIHLSGGVDGSHSASPTLGLGGLRQTPDGSADAWHAGGGGENGRRGGRAEKEGLPPSEDNWHLLSPDLHAQRHERLAGRQHGGSVSRKVVEELVEKMESKRASGHGYAGTGKLRELVTSGEAGDVASRDLEWV